MGLWYVELWDDSLVSQRVDGLKGCLLEGPGGRRERTIPGTLLRHVCGAFLMFSGQCSICFSPQPSIQQHDPTCSGRSEGARILGNMIQPSW